MIATLSVGNDQAIFFTTVVFPEPVPPAIPIMSIGRLAILSKQN